MPSFSTLDRKLSQQGALLRASSITECNVLSQIPDAGHIIEFEDWTRFDVYARRVRHLNFGTNWFTARSPNNINHEAQISFLCRRTGLRGPLLPNLRVLSASSCVRGTPPIECLFGPRMEKLSIGYQDPTLTSSLTYLHPFSPHLTSICLDVPDQYAMDRVVAVLSKLRDLHTVVVSCGARDRDPLRLTSEFCDAVAVLPVLKTLRLSYLLPPQGRPFSATSSTNPPLRFASLESLSFLLHRHEATALLLPLLREMNLSGLEEFALRFPTTGGNTHDPAPLGELASLLRRQVPHGQLKRLILHCQTCAGTSSLSMNAFRPLCAFGALEELTVPACLALDDGAVEELAQAWPKLTRLHAATIPGQRQRDSRNDRPTLQALSHLVRHCPDLRQLYFEFDSSKTELSLIPNVRPGGGASNTKVRQLGVGCSLVLPDRYRDDQKLVEYSFNVAAFLVDIFPNLSGLRAASGSLHSRVWDSVSAFVGQLSIVNGWSRI